jgi:hypothetical protein
MSKEKNVVVLEPSTNTHKIHGEVKVIEKLDQLNGLVLETNGECEVLHGEHGVIITEGDNIIKLNQQEFNPLSKQMQNAYD